MSLYHRRSSQPWLGQEHNHFIKRSDYGQVHASSGPLIRGLHSGHDLERPRHFARPPAKAEALRQMDPAYLQPADPRVARHFAAAPAGVHYLIPSAGAPCNPLETVIYVDSCGVPCFPYGRTAAPSKVVSHVGGAVEAPVIRVVQHPPGVILTGPAEVQSRQPSADVLTVGSSVGANPGLSASLLPVFMGDAGLHAAGLHAIDSPQLPSSLGASYTNQELYWQQLYWQQYYWHWYMQNYYSHLSYLEQWHIAWHQKHMENMAKQRRMTPPQQMGRRKREAFSDDEGFFSDSSSGLEAQADKVQAPSRTPRMNPVSEEPVVCDAVVTQEGEVFFSEHILDLLEVIPSILDLAAEMGFSV